MLVIMAIVTTLSTTPALHVVLGTGARAARTIQLGHVQDDES